MLLIYHAFFRSVANFGIIAWGAAFNRSLAPLIRLEAKILKNYNLEGVIVI